MPDRSIFGSHTIMAAASEALFTCRTAAGPTLRLIWMDSDLNDRLTPVFRSQVFGCNRGRVTFL